MMRTTRKKSGLTQAQLAKRVEVAVRTVRKWEASGIRHASLGNVEKAAAALGCEVADLLRDPDEGQDDEGREG